MAFAPIALTIPEYDRTLFSNWWLKSFEEGTVIPLTMATDATGGTLLAKAELDTSGFPITAGAVRFIPFIDGDYDLWLFPTEAEADANDTTNAIQFADDLNADPQSSNTFVAGSFTVANKAAAVLLTPVSGKSLVVESTDGGLFKVVTGAPGTFSDDSSAFCGTLFIPTGGDGSIAWLRDYDNSVSVKWFGTVSDGSTDDTVAIQTAIDAVETIGSGAVFLPEGTYRTTSALKISKRGISIFGEGAESSIIDALSCNGINFISAFYDRGTSFFQDFGLTGATGSAANFAAIETILPPGGVSGTDSRDGLHFLRLKIFDWNQGFVISDTWESSITLCKFQKVNQAIQFSTFSMVWRILNNYIVFEDGDSHGGTATSTGINMLGPVTEGLYVDGNQIFGFDIGVDLVSALHTNINKNDIFALVNGMRIATANTGCNIRFNYISVGANNAIGILAPGLGSPISNLNNCDGNVIQSTSAAFTGTVGIQLNTAVTQNNGNWNIEKNQFLLFTLYDIVVYNGNNTVIENNRSESTAVTASINVTGTLAGETVKIGDNDVIVVITSDSIFTDTVRSTFTPVVADAQTGGNLATGTFTGFIAKSGPIVNVTISLINIDTTGMTGANHIWFRGLSYPVATGATATGVIQSDTLTIVNNILFNLISGKGGRIYQNITGAAQKIFLVSDITSGSTDLTISLTYITDE